MHDAVNLTRRSWTVHLLVSGGVGHNLLQEAPHAFAEAIVEVDGYAE